MTNHEPNDMNAAFASTEIESLDDPRLTAHALGELEGEEYREAREAVDRYLARHPEAADELAALADLGNMLSAGLASEALPELDALRRDALETELASVGTPEPPGERAGLAAGREESSASVRAWRVWMAAAALLLAAVLVGRELVFELGGKESAGQTRDGLARAEEEPVGVRPSQANRVPAVGSARPGAEKPEQLRDLVYLGAATEQDDLRKASDPAVSSPVRAVSIPTVSSKAQVSPPDAPAELFSEGMPSEDPKAAGGPAPGVAEGVLPHAVPRRAKGGSHDPFDAGALRMLQALGYSERAIEEPAMLLSSVETSGRADFDDPMPHRPADRSSTSGESYAGVPENPFVRLSADPDSALSTFGLDVDSASYANVRRFLHRNQAPPSQAVRLEELINAFRYHDVPPPAGQALALSVEAATCPWAPEHRLVRIGLRGREIPKSQRPPSNLVFLLDVSGSMNSADKLPLLVQSLELLLDQLRDDDRVAIVTYASGTELVLPSTPCKERGRIVAALRGLSAGGSTNASAGIDLAYAQARQAFVEEGNNRVLLATDGDFNVGLTGHDELEDLIRNQASSGIYLTVLGFGTGNLKDDTAELLADKGNGNYAYIDSFDEARRVLVGELQGTLHTIAKDAKIQVEFNPGRVASYRLLGYENRALAAQDFRDDSKDAGEIGAGHSLTVLYEVVPKGALSAGGTADLRYQTRPDPDRLLESPEALTVNLRWIDPTGGPAHELALPLIDEQAGFAEASDDLRFAAAVAAFGMILKHSRYAGQIDLAEVAEIAERARGSDPDGRRAELVSLVRTARGVLPR